MTLSHQQSPSVRRIPGRRRLDRKVYGRPSTTYGKTWRDEGADVSARRGGDDSSRIHTAVRKGSEAMFQQLLDEGRQRQRAAK